jgi:hypothetical protein
MCGLKLVEFTWRVDVVKHNHLVVFTSLLIFVFMLSLLNITYSFFLVCESIIYVVFIWYGTC